MKFFRYLFALFLLTSGLLAGCSLFETRTPEEPTASGDDYRPPTSYQNVMSNFQIAVLNKDIYKFKSCFVGAQTANDSLHYVFEPSAEAAVRFAGQFQDWNIDKEEQAFLQLTSKFQGSFPISFFNEKSPVLQVDSVQYIIDYSILYKDSIEYTGTASFIIKRLSNSQWAIRKWTDYAKQAPQKEDHTWSVLKVQP